MIIQKQLENNIVKNNPLPEFIFSTQRASTSPSNTIHLISFSFPGGNLSFNSRNNFDRIPSVQSLVTGSISPYNSFNGWALGFKTYIFTTIFSDISLEFLSVSSTRVLPPPVGPTIMVVCRTNWVSYIWITCRKEEKEG